MDQYICNHGNQNFRVLYLKKWFLIIGVIVLFYLLIFFLNNYTINYISSGSMEPTIKTNSIIICHRIKNIKIERGDIITFYSPIDHKICIKRVIGLPNENVCIKKGTVYINDEILDEPYLIYKWTKRRTGYMFNVPKEHYLVLGDNRNVSDDSRSWQEEANHMNGSIDSTKIYVPAESIISIYGR